MTGRLVWYGVASFCNLYRLATTTEDTQASCAAAFRIFGGSHRVSCDHGVKDETTSVYDTSPPLFFLGKPCHEFTGEGRSTEPAGWTGEPLSTCPSKL